jgi:hypothetical protein
MLSMITLDGRGASASGLGSHTNKLILFSVGAQVQQAKFLLLIFRRTFHDDDI